MFFVLKQWREVILLPFILASEYLIAEAHKLLRGQIIAIEQLTLERLDKILCDLVLVRRLLFYLQMLLSDTVHTTNLNVTLINHDTPCHAQGFGSSAIMTALSRLNEMIC